MRVKDAVALVTGGASGLGEATVRLLHKNGAKVVIVDRDVGRGEALVKALGNNAVFAQTDVTSEEQVNAAIEKGQAMGGVLRIAVNCAGLGFVGRTLSREGQPHDLECFKTIIGVNLIGTFNVLRLSASAMAKTEALEDGERGVIINTASVAAFDGQIGQIAYAASKGGVVAMALPAARDLSVIGIRVLTIAPGTFDTPMMASLPEAARQGLAAGIPFPRRLGNPGEYAALVQQMIENRYLNGEVIRIDGSLRMPPK